MNGNCIKSTFLMNFTTSISHFRCSVLYLTFLISLAWCDQNAYLIIYLDAPPATGCHLLSSLPSHEGMYQLYYALNNVKKNLKKRVKIKRKNVKNSKIKKSVLIHGRVNFFMWIRFLGVCWIFMGRFGYVNSVVNLVWSI